MEFAIVRFVEEEDAPGIVSTNWIDFERGTCWFPSVRSEEKKNKLLLAREVPDSNWIECPIRILKEFASYQAARNHLSEAEETSNLESCDEGNRRRKRKKKSVRLPGETSSSEEDLTFREIEKPLYPAPPPLPVETLQMCAPSSESASLPISNSQGLTFNQPVIHPVSHLYNPTPPRVVVADDRELYSRKSPISGLKTVTKPVFHPYAITPRRVTTEPVVASDEELYSIKSPLSGLKTLTKAATHPYTITPRRVTAEPVVANDGEEFHSIKSPVSGRNSEIAQIKVNQQTMWGVISEVLSATQRLETKLDSVLFHLERLQSPTMPENIPMNEDIRFISSLPVGSEDFNQLNKRIAENSSFRQKLAKILITAGGRDARGLASNVLRKLITDDCAEYFSLTGKLSKTGIGKQAFERTESYNLVLEICSRTYSDLKESVVREAISDWLMQAKFRKGRREKRLSASTSHKANDESF